VQELKESEERYRNLFNSIDEAEASSVFGQGREFICRCRPQHRAASAGRWTYRFALLAL